jgi:hypothetical protein
MPSTLASAVASGASSTKLELATGDVGAFAEHAAAGKLSHVQELVASGCGISGQDDVQGLCDALPHM